MGHSTSSGRTGNAAARTENEMEQRARSASLETVFSTYETNINARDIGDQMIANSAERELQRRLSETSYADLPDVEPLANAREATPEERRAWIRSASNGQLMSAFNSAAGRLSRSGIPESIVGEQYRSAKAEITRRINGSGDSERRRRNAQVMDEAVRRAQRRKQEERRRGREAARNMENISRRGR